MSAKIILIPMIFFSIAMVLTGAKRLVTKTDHSVRNIAVTGTYHHNANRTLMNLTHVHNSVEDLETAGDGTRLQEAIRAYGTETFNEGSNGWTLTVHNSMSPARTSVILRRPYLERGHQFTVVLGCEKVPDMKSIYNYSLLLTQLTQDQKAVRHIKFEAKLTHSRRVFLAKDSFFQLRLPFSSRQEGKGRRFSIDFQMVEIMDGNKQPVRLSAEVGSRDLLLGHRVLPGVQSGFPIYSIDRKMSKGRLRLRKALLANDELQKAFGLNEWAKLIPRGQKVRFGEFSFQGNLKNKVISDGRLVVGPVEVQGKPATYGQKSLSGNWAFQYDLYGGFDQAFMLF